MALVLCGVSEQVFSEIETGNVPNATDSKPRKLTKDVCLMPCEINHNGPASVSRYFQPYVEEDEASCISTAEESCDSGNSTKDLKANFRGYPLQGRNLTLPGDYYGLVMQETCSVGGCEERQAHLVKAFKELTYWNWDKQPSANDAIMKLQDWMDISKQIHSPDVKTEN